MSAFVEPVQVMILGVYHFANNNRDIHNVKAEDMLVPKRQKELADLADHLARFVPTKVAVEAKPNQNNFADVGYEEFTTENLTQNPNEIVQIGYRLAKHLDHKIVYAVDEWSETVDYFPWGLVESFAETHGQAGVLEKLHVDMSAKVAALEAVQKAQPVRLALALLNEPEAVLSEHNLFYYTCLMLADHESQPGAELNAMWYMRNAKIFAKLIQVSEPGDRIVVVYGAGHSFWLRHFVEHTPGCQLVEPNKYLK